MRHSTDSDTDQENRRRCCNVDTGFSGKLVPLRLSIRHSILLHYNGVPHKVWKGFDDSINQNGFYLYYSNRDRQTEIDTNTNKTQVQEEREKDKEEEKKKTGVLIFIIILILPKTNGHF